MITSIDVSNIITIRGFGEIVNGGLYITFIGDIEEIYL